MKYFLVLMGSYLAVQMLWFVLFGFSDEMQDTNSRMMILFKAFLFSSFMTFLTHLAIKKGVLKPKKK